MKMISENEIKTLQLQMLDTLHQICIENNIQYFLMYGSLLGAIRHNGFIPWDDDIDVVMFREEYYRLRKVFHTEGMALIDCETDENYYLPIPKMINTRTILKEDVDSNYDIGVYIDVFLLDAVNPKSFSYKFLLLKELFFRVLLASKMLRGSDKRKGIKKIIHNILNVLLKNIDMNTVSRAMNTLAKNSSLKNYNADTLQIFTQTEAHNLKKNFKKDWFHYQTKCNFENKVYYGPVGYDEVLRCLYGNYMFLPPESERISKHSFDAFWKYD